MTDTIFALATPPGRGAIAVIRLSGSSVDPALTALGATRLKPRLAAVRQAYNLARKTVLQLFGSYQTALIR